MIITGDVIEYDVPEQYHELGPQWDCPIDDALSRARGNYLQGKDVIWIYSTYRKSLQELIDRKIWRSADAAQFALVLDRAYFNKMRIQFVAVSQKEFA